METIKNNHWAVIIVCVIVVVLAFWGYQYSTENEPVVCTLEAKLCPDGSYVGRIGPKCEFAQCPSEGGMLNWQTVTDTENGISFKYPKAFSTKYIEAYDWPPKAQVLDKSLVCTEGGSENERAGKTERRLVDDRSYCVTKVIEGAAGSIHTQYAYAFLKEEKTVILTFSTRASQCGNYPENEMNVCLAERETFDVDGVVDRIVQTTEFLPNP